MEKYVCREPKAGDILKVEIKNNIFHYGIYLGNDEVIQYGLAKDFLNTKKEDVEVLISSMDDFLNGKMALVRVYSFKEKLKKNKVDKIISLAKARLKEKRYDPVENNCEHFVNECVFNKHYSSQTESYKK